MKNDLHYYILCCGVLQASKKSEVKKIKTKLFQGRENERQYLGCRIVTDTHTKKCEDKFLIVCAKNVRGKVSEIEKSFGALFYRHFDFHSNEYPLHIVDRRKRYE
jgi:hypothetical protein